MNLKIDKDNLNGSVSCNISQPCAKNIIQKCKKNKKGTCFAINKVGIIMIELNACNRAKYIYSYITSDYKPYPQPYLYVKKDSKLLKKGC